MRRLINVLFNRQPGEKQKDEITKSVEESAHKARTAFEEFQEAAATMAREHRAIMRENERLRRRA